MRRTTFNKLLAWIEPRHGEGECVAAFVSVYHGTVPLLVLSGEADDWVPPSNCLAFGKQLKPNQPFEIHTYSAWCTCSTRPRSTPSG